MELNTLNDRLNAIEAVADYLNGIREAFKDSENDPTECACKLAIERLWEVMKAAHRDRK